LIMISNGFTFFELVAGSRFELLICGYPIVDDYEPAGMT
jgi:hypothetical protein